MSNDLTDLSKLLASKLTGQTSTAEGGSEPITVDPMDTDLAPPTSDSFNSESGSVKIEFTAPGTPLEGMLDDGDAPSPSSPQSESTIGFGGTQQILGGTAPVPTPGTQGTQPSLGAHVTTRANVAPPLTPGPQDPLSPEPKSRGTQPPPSNQQSTVGEIREFAARTPVGAPQVQAAYPFSLKINGRLSEQEQEKLVDTLNRHNMGVRDVDLELQFKSGRVLIPRISEYAGVLLIQAMRGAQVEMELAPSDEIFSTEDTRTPEHDALSPSVSAEAIAYTAAPEAEHMPVTTGDAIAHAQSQTVIDVVSASAALKSLSVEAEKSTEYQETLEALIRELKYKTHRKGGNAIIHLHVSLFRLSAPSLYRLTVVGSAVKAKTTPRSQ